MELLSIIHLLSCLFAATNHMSFYLYLTLIVLTIFLNQATCQAPPTSRIRVQAALPYKSKPKVLAPQKRQTLEQKRAVVLEPAERKAVSLVQQLNALRNEKAIKRREKQARQRQVEVIWAAQGRKTPAQRLGWIKSFMLPMTDILFLNLKSLETAGNRGVPEASDKSMDCRLGRKEYVIFGRGWADFLSQCYDKV